MKIVKKLVEIYYIDIKVLGIITESGRGIQTRGVRNCSCSLTV